MIKYGPNSILILAFGNMRLNSLIGAGVTTWGDQSGSGWLAGTTLSMGTNYFWGVSPGSQSDIFHSKAVVLFGYLPTILEGNGNTEAMYLHAAKEQGVKFISIDPRYTVDAQALNSQWIPIKPGTDLALILAIEDVLLRGNLYDQAFVKQWVEPNGFAQFQNYVLGTVDGVEKTPQWAEAICGVPARSIEALANFLVQNNPTKIHIGYEMCRSTSVSITRAAIALQAMTGYLMSPGGGIGFGTLGNNPWGPQPNIYAVDNFQAGSYNVPDTINTLKWQKAVLLREQFDNGSLTAAQYNGLIGMTADAPTVNIKVMTFPYFMKQHTIDIFGASERIEATKKIFTWGAFSIVNSNALYMDIILPALERYLEEPGEQYGGGVNRFYSPSCGGNPWTAYAAPVVEPQGEAMPEEWAYLMLAKRFGVGDQYNPDLSAVLSQDEWNLTKWNTTVEGLSKAGYEAFAQSVQIAPLNPPSWEQFKQNPVWRCDVLDLPAFALPSGTTSGPFDGTASKKVELYSDYLADPNNAATQTFAEGSWTQGCLGKVGPGEHALSLRGSQIWSTQSMIQRVRTILCFSYRLTHKRATTLMDSQVHSTMGSATDMPFGSALLMRAQGEYRTEIW